MKRTALGAGLFACAVIFAAGSTSQVSAETMSSALDNRTVSNVQLAVIDRVERRYASTLESGTVPPPATPVEHTIVAGESLSQIAAQHQTTWKRLYDKNTDITDPDVIVAGAKLIVPEADEQLTERALPVPAPQPATQPAVRAATPAPRQATKPKTAPKATQSVRQGSVAGNTYTPGQCTWHVKNLRGASLPNGLGNASQWYGRAQAMGLSTGTKPVVGAAGVRKSGNHAVYVTAVHGNGTITVSEMNYNYTPYATRTAIKNASDFYYIY